MGGCSLECRVMWRLLFILFCFLSASSCESPSNSAPRIEDLVLPEGYPLETHIVNTEDGYNLGVYRIPHGRFQQPFPEGTQRTVVYMQHGLLDTSATFLMNGAEGSLGFLLADSGFDVWLGNSRGNTFSNFALQKQNLGHDQFWDYSLDELVHYDLPATLQYVLDQTGADTLVYIGHSQGTAIAHALFSTQHPITQRISIALMMSPVAFVKHIQSHFLRTLALINTDDFVAALGFHQFLPTQDNIYKIMGPFCRATGYTCTDVYALLYGYNPDNIDPEGWSTYLRYTPAGASVKLMAYWAQSVRKREDTHFRYYDYGTKCWDWLRFKRLKCNQNMYNSRHPPEYDLSKIQVPLVYFHGGHDALADVVDVSNLKAALSPGVLVEEHLYLDYMHLDFIWGIDTPGRVYNRIIEIIHIQEMGGTLGEGAERVVV